MIKFKNDEIHEKVSKVTPLIAELSKTKDYDLALDGLINYNRIIDFMLEYIFELEQYVTDNEHKLTRE